MNSGEKRPHTKGAERKALEDREFLQRVSTSTWDELEVMLMNHRHPDTPVWKRIAISRAFLKLARKIP
jgi:hypothetical protein